MMPLRVGSKCWTMTNAMPLFFGTRDRKCSNASNPPAEAPMPTTGNETRTGETGGSGGATVAGFSRRRASEGFFFMRLFPACVSGIGLLRCQNLVRQVSHLFLTETRMFQHLACLILLEFLFQGQRGDPVPLE
jgi:hypothetical protein